MDELVDSLKKYVRLQKEYVRLELIEKLSLILSGLVLVLAMICLGMIALFYFSFAMVYILAQYVGGEAVSFSIVTACILLLLLIIYFKREALIVKPFVRFLAKHLTEDSEETEETEE